MPSSSSGDAPPSKTPARQSQNSASTASAPTESIGPSISASSPSPGAKGSKAQSAIDPAAAWPFPTPGAPKRKTTDSLASADPSPSSAPDADGIQPDRAGDPAEAFHSPSPAPGKEKTEWSFEAGSWPFPLDGPDRQIIQNSVDASAARPFSTEPAGRPARPATSSFERDGETVGIDVDQGPTRVEQLASSDALDRDRITKALVQLISNRIDVAPIAIGLFGHWGSGKSSQVEFVKKALAQRSELHIRCAEFNGWEHEKNENLGAALAQTVVEALVKDLGFFDQLRLSVRLSIRRKSKFTRALSTDATGASAWFYRWATILTPLVLPALLLAFVAFVALKNLELPALNATKNWVGSIATAIGAMWLGWHKFVSSNLTHWFKRISSGSPARGFSLPDYSSKLGSFHEIHSTLKHLCALQLRGNEETPASGDYLFLVIDDLDRCTPETVKQIFDAVRLVASIPRVVTLVAIDDRMAFAAVSTHYAQFNFAGREVAQVARDHLAKVFQVAVTLPPVDPGTSARFILNKLFAGDLDKSPTDAPGAPDAGTAGLGSGASAAAKDDPTVRNVLPEEVALFAQLANETSISNPRELWRLKQAWFLLKGMVLQDGDGLAQMAPWMRSLFVREWELQANSATRWRIATLRESWRNSGAREIVQQSDLAVLNLELEGASARQHFVDAVLLPSARCDEAKPSSRPE